MAEKPELAARITAEWIKRYQSYFSDALVRGDSKPAWKTETGGYVNINEKVALYNRYYDALQKAENSNSPVLKITAAEDWLTFDVPLLLKALRNAGVSDLRVQAFALAAADHEAVHGTYMLFPRDSRITSPRQ